MEKIISCIIIATSLVVIAIAFFIIINKENCPSGSYPIISFNQFITLYKLNPEKWTLRYGYVEYRYLYNKEWSYSKTIEFATVVDALRYKRWAKKVAKREKELKKNKEMASLIGEWQKDIDEAQRANVQRTKELMKKNEEDAKKYGEK